MPSVNLMNIEDLILNEIKLSSDNLDLFNIHDYAIFVQPDLIPEWWFNKLRPRPIKSTHNSSKLWAKVRAITYLTARYHRQGSWYSDDPTEKSPIDDVSLSDNDEQVNEKTDSIE